MIERPDGRDLTRGDLVTVARQFGARPELWTRLVAHDPDAASYEQLVRDDRLAIWLICSMDDHDRKKSAVGAVAGDGDHSLGRNISLAGSRKSRTVSTSLWAPPWSHEDG